MRFLFLITFFGVVFSTFAQEDEGHEHGNEIGISIAPVLFKPSNELSFGVHTHYVRNVFGNVGVGIGAEYIFNEERHQTYSVILDYSLIDHLHIVAAPGIALEQEQGQYEIVFALHLETVYEFELKHFSLGPSFEFAYDPHDIHYSLGLHIGIPF